MKSFIVGLIIGLVVAFPLGVNVGKGKPMFSNPLAEKPVMEQLKDTAKNAGDQIKETTDEAMEKTKEAIDKASE